METVPAILQMSVERRERREAVLADLYVLPLEQGDRPPALGWDILIQHGAARLALGGRDEAADLLPLFHAADKIQGLVSARLGHSDPSVTARIYAHSYEEGIRRAGQTVRDALKAQAQ